MPVISLVDDADAHAWHEKLDPIWEVAGPEEIYAAVLHSARPYALCGIALAAHLFDAKGVPLVLHAPTHARHLEEMEFYSALPASLDVRNREPMDVDHNWKALLPLRHIQDASQASEAVEEFILNCRASSGWIRGLGMRVGNWCLAEALDNALEHGKSAAGCFAAAWTHSATGSLNLAIVDGGIGIPAHLRGRPIYADLDDDELLTMALKDRVTGVDDKERGFGLANVRDSARIAGRGALAIRAGAAEIKVELTGRRDRRGITTMISPPLGTWVRIELTPPKVKRRS